MNTLPQSGPSPQPAQTRSPTLLRIGFWLCVVIGVAAVLRRLFALAAPSTGGPPQMAGLDNALASHAALTLAHIIPAMLFVLLSPFVVFARFAHFRWPERLVFPFGVIVGITAYAMSIYSIGGWTERSAILLFNSLFLFSLGRSWWHRRHHESALKRRWLLRSIAILLGIGTARPVMGVFFATSRLTHLTPNQFFGIAMWIGFFINLLVFELWIHSADRRSALLASSAIPAFGHPGHGRGLAR